MFGYDLKLTLDDKRIKKYLEGIHLLLMYGKADKETFDKLIGRLSFALIITDAGKSGYKTGR